jgi:DNA-binding transcriptional MerR regulator
VTCRPLGEVEIAALLGVRPTTPRQWRKRGLLPPPEGTVSGRPWWSEKAIREWAKETDRLP